MASKIDDHHRASTFPEKRPCQMIHKLVEALAPFLKLRRALATRRL